MKRKVTIQLHFFKATNLLKKNSLLGFITRYKTKLKIIVLHMQKIYTLIELEQRFKGIVRRTVPPLRRYFLLVM